MASILQRVKKLESTRIDKDVVELARYDILVNGSSILPSPLRTYQKKLFELLKNVLKHTYIVLKNNYLIILILLISSCLYVLPTEISFCNIFNDELLISVMYLVFTTKPL